MSDQVAEKNGEGRLDSLNQDGSRKIIHPADVSGRYTTRRNIVFAILLIILLVMPLININGNPAILLDIPGRRFYLFGLVFNGHDAWMLFFLLTGLGFSLVTVTALWGRIWCGFACPQTVFVEGLYRKIERLLEGPREARIKLDKSPWNGKKILVRGGKYVAYMAVSIGISHLLLGYFIPVKSLWSMIALGPAAHPEAFGWVTGATLLFFFDFGIFREQFCVVMCPYGRLQSVMTDRDSIIVGYDAKRGEPRGKLKVLNRGGCVDCGRCVAVCPTGIDIRNGLQLDCVGCTACIDACDEIMRKTNQPEGLIRYDSEVALEGGKTRLLRPRTFMYAFAGLLGATVFSVTLFNRSPFDAVLVRLVGAPYSMDQNEIRNQFKIHLVNKKSHPETYLVEGVTQEGVSFVISQEKVDLAPTVTHEIPVFVTVSKDKYKGDFQVQLKVTPQDAPQEATFVKAKFVGPK